MAELSLFSQYVADEAEMCAFGHRLVETICSESHSKGVTLYLNGPLGAGKTTLSRGIIQGLGHKGKVKSPTYTLVEEYRLQDKNIYHFDLYRLNDPEELEFMGIRDYFTENSICLIEWAEKGQGLLAEPDLLVNIDYANNARNVQLIAKSKLGNNIIKHLHLNN
jgi:hydrolase, P-loop family